MGRKSTDADEEPSPSTKRRSRGGLLRIPLSVWLTLLPLLLVATASATTDKDAWECLDKVGWDKRLSCAAQRLLSKPAATQADVDPKAEIASADRNAALRPAPEKSSPEAPRTSNPVQTPDPHAPPDHGYPWEMGPDFATPAGLDRDLANAQLERVQFDLAELCLRGEAQQTAQLIRCTMKWRDNRLTERFCVSPWSRLHKCLKNEAKVGAIFDRYLGRGGLYERMDRQDAFWRFGLELTPSAE